MKHGTTDFDPKEMVTPGTEFVEITPSNTEDLAHRVRGIYVGTGGDLKINDWGGNTITFVGLSAGVIHPIGATRVWEDSTADGIVGVY